jgi:hypothetical protein
MMPCEVPLCRLLSGFLQDPSILRSEANSIEAQRPWIFVMLNGKDSSRMVTSSFGLGRWLSLERTQVNRWLHQIDTLGDLTSVSNSCRHIGVHSRFSANRLVQRLHVQTKYDFAAQGLPPEPQVTILRLGLLTACRSLAITVCKLIRMEAELMYRQRKNIIPINQQNFAFHSIWPSNVGVSHEFLGSEETDLVNKPWHEQKLRCSLQATILPYHVERDLHVSPSHVGFCLYE